MLIKPGVHYEITLRVTIIFSTMVAPTLQITNINRTDVWKLSSFSQNLGPMCSPWQNEAILLDFFFSVLFSWSRWLVISLIPIKNVDNNSINIFQNSKLIQKKIWSWFHLSVNNTLLNKENLLINLLTKPPNIILPIL